MTNTMYLIARAIGALTLVSVYPVLMLAYFGVLTN